MVEDEVYRSGVPTTLNYEVIIHCCLFQVLLCNNFFSFGFVGQFLRSLGLRSIILLESNIVDDKFADFLTENNVQIIDCSSAPSASIDSSLKSADMLPITDEVITEALRVVADSKNLPTIVVCKTGRVFVPTVIACLRKLQHWSMTSILEEFRRYAMGVRQQQQLEQLIEVFDVEQVEVSSDTPSFLTR